MKARPIIFSGPMVLALLREHDSKTQTRRAIKLPRWSEPCNEDADFEMDGDPLWPHAIAKKTGCMAPIKCPYGEVGDLLWVRETWTQAHPLAFQEGRNAERLLYAGIPGPPPVDYLVGYRADGELRPLWHKQGYPYRALEPQDDFSRKHYPHGADGGWWSVLEMPRRASRLTLRIIEVRAQQLRDISEADCKAEGIFQTDTGLWSWEKPGVRTAQGAAWAGPDHAFANLYESINGQGSWEHNPWVWAISFEVIRDNVEKIIRAAAPP